MAKINTYSIDEAVTNEDRVVGTDGKTGETKNFLLSDVLDIIQSNTTIVNFRNSNGSTVETAVVDDYALAEHTYTIPGGVASAGDIFKFEADFQINNADSTDLPLVDFIFNFLGEFTFSSFLPTGPTSADTARVRVSGTVLINSATSSTILVDFSASSLSENLFQFKPGLLNSSEVPSFDSDSDVSLAVQWDASGSVTGVSILASSIYKI